MRIRRSRRPILFIALAALAGEASLAAQSSSLKNQPENPRAPAPAGVTPPPGYIIGTDDVLDIVFWRDKDMSSEVVVRPDGKISLPLINEIEAAGLTPDRLRASLEEAAARFIEE